MTEAILIYSYGMPTLDMSLSSLIKYFPKDVPIYLLDTIEADDAPRKVADWRPWRKAWLKHCVQKYNGRIDLIDCLNVYSHLGFEGSMKRFCVAHPEIDYIYKADDDYIYTDYGTLEGLREAYNSVDNALLACGLSPIQSYCPTILNERLHGNLPKEVTSCKTYNGLYESEENRMALWNLSFPPDKVIPHLRKGERFVPLPECGQRRTWSAGHYYIRRIDMLESYSHGRTDEQGLNWMRVRQGRPIIFDTYTLIYHYAWRAFRDWTDKYIFPLFQKEEFWRLSYTT